MMSCTRGASEKDIVCTAVRSSLRPVRPLGAAAVSAVCDGNDGRGRFVRALDVKQRHRVAKYCSASIPTKHAVTTGLKRRLLLQAGVAKEILDRQEGKRKRKKKLSLHFAEPEQQHEQRPRLFSRSLRGHAISNQSV